MLLIDLNEFIHDIWVQMASNYVNTHHQKPKRIPNSINLILFIILYFKLISINNFFIRKLKFIFNWIKSQSNSIKILNGSLFVYLLNHCITNTSFLHIKYMLIVFHLKIHSQPKRHSSLFYIKKGISSEAQREIVHWIKKLLNITKK